MNNGEQIKTEAPENKGLWDTRDVMTFTGWGRTYVQKLCTLGMLPHIPTKPKKFIPAEVQRALVKMQTGGEYGRRRSKIQTQRKVRTNEAGLPV